MLQLDVLSSFAICGAGALVGAGVLRPSLTPDEAGAESLRICRGAYALIGAGLLQPLALDVPLPLWSQAAMVFASIGGVIMIAWSVAALVGERIGRGLMAFALATAFAAVLAAWPAGAGGLNVTVALGLAVASGVLAWLGRRLVLRPRDVHERMVGAVVVVMVLSSTLRASYLFTWDGPWESHLMHLPPAMVAPFTLLYGVLPVVFAMLLNNVINARLLARMHQRAMTDHLTGSLSRHALVERASTVIARARAVEGAVAVIMVDLDFFKQVNDRHGHTGGDAVLRHAVQLLQAELRGEALLARYGGEEFVVLAPVADLPVARRIGERMRLAIEGAGWPEVVLGLGGVTASLGVTLLSPHEPLEAALRRADEALYRAKNLGRNQVQVGLTAA